MVRKGLMGQGFLFAWAEKMLTLPLSAYIVPQFEQTVALRAAPFVPISKAAGMSNA